MNGRLITTCALALSFLAMSGKAAIAQDRRPDQTGRSYDEQNRFNNHDRFNDHDRQVTRDWYQQHQRGLGAGWRQRDRLSPAMQARLRAGRRLDPQLRRQMHSLPPDLARQYRPAPRGYHYAVIGGNIVLLDNGDQVRDVFSLTLHF
jgi:Ni/Co efflux regulator RcnB